MKIGILTFPFANNYGAALQTYALYRAIKLLGVDVEVIRYENHKMEKATQKSYFFNSSSIKELIKSTVYYPALQLRKRSFKSFNQTFVNYSVESYTDDSDLSRLENKYDKIISGSDQVWNYLITGDDYNFYLKFCSDSKKKAAYAASFGIDHITEDRKENIAKLLTDFSHLSVREKSGQKIINDLTGHEAKLVCDPTFLLSKYEWHEVVKYYKPFTRKYIVLYNFGSDSLSAFAKEVSRKTSLQLITLDGSIKNIFSSKDKPILGIGPLEWVGLLSNAEYIITNSFHGTAFAINFQKKFFTELLPAGSMVNTRLENILDTYQLRERQILNGQNQNIFQEIDFVKVDKILKNERQSSLDYLRSIINSS